MAVGVLWLLCLPFTDLTHFEASIFHPERFHGYNPFKCDGIVEFPWQAGTNPYFEGWYYKFTNAENMIAVIAGVYYVSFVCVLRFLLALFGVSTKEKK